MDVCIKELKHFAHCVTRDVVADLRSSRLATDETLLRRVIDYGNSFLDRERQLPEHQRSCIWFDIHWGEPAQVGMTWAYNPLAPDDDRYPANYFWRMWTEAGAANECVLTLEQAQLELGRYMLQHVTAVRH